jgi:hypothetical protein
MVGCGGEGAMRDGKLKVKRRSLLVRRNAKTRHQIGEGDQLPEVPLREASEW